MSYSYTLSTTTTFTVTHAKHISAKVATDLKRMQRFYGKPTDSNIFEYEAEIIELLKSRCLGTVTYGFWRDGAFIEPTLQYAALELINSFAEDSDPGRIRPGADVGNASFYSYLTYSTVWDSMSPSEKDALRSRLPFQRGTAPEPEMDGYLNEDRYYSSGGRALRRSSLRGF